MDTEEGISSIVEDETELLESDRDYVAAQDFEGQETGDLPFKEGEILTILRPSEMVLWYVARNAAGKMGTIPATYLNKIPNPRLPPPPPPAHPHGPPPIIPQKSTPAPHTPPFHQSYAPSPHLPSPVIPHAHHSPPLVSGPPPPLPVKGTAPEPTGPLDNDYEKMVPAPTLPPKAQKHMTEEEKEILKVQEKEQIRRLAKGTLIIATAAYEAEREGDLSFSMYEEAMIVEPLPDLGWYLAHKAENPSIRGAIPITHFRLVYMSDDEDEDDTCKSPTIPTHDRLYDDITDFISTSGWFYQPGMAQGKNAILHVLAKKANMEVDAFKAVKQAVYVLKYHVNEKVFVGKAEVLHEELMKHFECFGKTRKEIREIDDELCHHTDSAGWELKAHPIEPDQVLEVEWAKMVIINDALNSSDESGANEQLVLTCMTNFDKFWEWLSPN